jgi:methyl-accepting chemotaxis protein
MAPSTTAAERLANAQAAEAEAQANKAAADSMAELLEAEKELAIATLELTRAQLEHEKATTNDANEIARLNALIDDNRKALKEATQEQENYNNSLQAGASYGSQFASSLGIVDSQMSNLLDSVGKGTFSLTGFANGLKSSISPGKVAAAVLQTYADANLQLFNSIQTVTSELTKAYGSQQTQKIIGSVNSIERGLRKFNIGYEETAMAVESLNVGVSDYIDLSDEQREGLARDSALMTKFGVSNQEYSSTVQEMTKAFGDSVEGAQENMREMRSFSNSIGKSTKEVMSDFTKVQSFLAQYGSNYEKIFRRMEVITRKTGVAIEDLQAIAQGFDQFEGAAESVGKLNALLGGPFLNTIDMLNTEDPAEQILKLKQAFDSAGKSVNSMSRREMQAFAASIPGINGDIGKMRKLFGQLDSGILDSADGINEFLEGSEDSTTSMEQQAAATMTMSDNIAAMQKNFAEAAESMKPMVENLTKITNAMVNLGQNTFTFFAGIAKVFSKLSFLWDFTGKLLEAGEFMAGFGKNVFKLGDTLGHVFGKNLLKRIPGISLLMGVVSAISRVMNGDISGAVAELASGALSTFLPGLGTAVSMGIDAALLTSDAYGGTIGENAYALASWAGSGLMGLMGYGGEEAEPTEMAAGGVVTSEVRNVTIGEAGKEAVLPLETNTDYLGDPCAKAMKAAMPAMAGAGGTPNINLTVVLEGREMRAFVKSVVADTLNPYK